jgi:hypothetical protein
MPRGMSKKRIRFWQDRLARAHRLWAKKGYPNRPSEAHAANDDVSDILAAYEGKHWESMFGAESLLERRLVMDNVFFSTVNVLTASLYARDPQTDVIATAPEAKDNAARQERFVNHLIRSPKLRHKRTWNRTLFDAMLFHFGIDRHGFTPRAEKYDKDGGLLDNYDAARADFPWIRRVAPWDIRIDTDAESFHPDIAGWCAFRDLIPAEQAKKHPRLKSDIRPTRSSIDHLTGNTPSRIRRNGPAGGANLVEVWWIYDKIDREWFALSDGLPDEAAAEPDAWPIPTWQSLPYDLLQFNPMPDDPFGTTFSRQILPLQRELNVCLTIANQLTQSIRRTLFVNEMALADGEKAKFANLALMEAIFVKGEAKDAMLQAQIGGLPQELLLYIQFLIAQIREVLGVSEMERGQRINVETAAEANQVGAGFQMQRGRNQGPWEDFLSDSIATFGLSLQYVLTDRVAIPILGGDDAHALFGGQGNMNPFEMVAPKQIQGDFIYRVRPGSTLPRDPMEDVRKELAVNQALSPFGDLVNLPQRAIDTLRAFEKDPARNLMSPQEVQKRRAVAAQQGASPNQEEPKKAGVDAGLANLISMGGGKR